MSYVQKIIDRFGGVRPMAKAVGKPVSTVNSWNTRGSIPDVNKPLVLASAKSAGIDLGKADFFPEPNAPVQAAE